MSNDSNPASTSPTAGELPIRVFQAPLDAPTQRALATLLGHKGEPWMTDIRARYAGSGPDFAAVAYDGNTPVAHVWVGLDASDPTVGVLGHVFTLPSHRGRGLASRLLAAVLAAADAAGAQWIELGTGNAAAVRLYERVGFRVWTQRPGQDAVSMLRGPGGITPTSAEAINAALYDQNDGEDGEATTNDATFTRAHYAGAVMLLNAISANGAPNAKPLAPDLRIRDGRDAESKLLEAIVNRPEGVSLRVSLRPDGRVNCLTLRTEAWIQRLYLADL